MTLQCNTIQMKLNNEKKQIKKKAKRNQWGNSKSNEIL